MFEYGPVLESDLPQVADVFAESFRDSVTHMFGDVVPLKAIEDLFRACLDSEPGCFHVARDESRVAGYIFAPSSTLRLWKIALLRGHVLRWIGRWIRGEYGFRMRPVGALMADKVGFMSSALTGGPYVDARILSVAVSPQYRGRGLGSALVQAGLDYLERRGVFRVRLEVRPANTPAVAMYTSFGFVEAGFTSDSQGKWMIMIRESRRPRRIEYGTGGDQRGIEG